MWAMGRWNEGQGESRRRDRQKRGCGSCEITKENQFTEAGEGRRQRTCKEPEPEKPARSLMLFSSVKESWKRSCVKAAVNDGKSSSELDKLLMY